MEFSEAPQGTPRCEPQTAFCLQQGCWETKATMPACRPSSHCGARGAQDGLPGLRTLPVGLCIPLMPSDVANASAQLDAVIVTQVL